MISESFGASHDVILTSHAWRFAAVCPSIGFISRIIVKFYPQQVTRGIAAAAATEAAAGGRRIFVADM